MNQEGKMSPEILLCAVAFAVIVAAVYLYIVRENNDYAKLAEGVKQFNATHEKITEEQGKIREILKSQIAWQEKQQELNDKFMQRLQLIDMRLDTMKSVHPVQFPKSMKLEMDMRTPVPIQVIHAAKKLVKKPTAKTPLLEKSGIKNGAGKSTSP